jgi:hypothetical protein
MYAMTHKIDINVSIGEGIIEATFATCKEVCTDPLSDTIKLYNSKNL